MKKINNQKGFTLIEVIIYIALFALLIGGAFIAAYQLIDVSGKLSAKTSTQEEGNFVNRKIDWALTGVQSITAPSIGTPNSGILTVTKYGGNQVDIRLTGTKIEIKESAGPNVFLPITTDNIVIKASSLNFQYLPTNGPAGVAATFIVVKDGVDFPFSVTKYIRK